MKRSKYVFFTGMVVGAALLLALEVLLLLGFSRTDVGYRFLVRRASARLRVPVFEQARADYDWEAARLETGETISAAALRDRTVFLTFWHPGCPYCVAQLPHIQALYEKAQNEDVVFWTVAEKGDAETVESFTAKVQAITEELGLTTPVMLSDGARPEAFRSRGTPVTFILSPDGEIAFRYDGGAKWNDEACLRFLQQISSGAAPTPAEPTVPPV